MNVTRPAQQTIKLPVTRMSTPPPIPASWALLGDVATDLAWRGKHDRRAVTPHAIAHHHRLSRCGPHVAGIGLESKVELPDLIDLAVRCLDDVGVIAVGDRCHLFCVWRMAEIGFW